MTRLLHRFLGSGDALARLQDHAARLRRLQGALDTALPPQMKAQCQLANLKVGTLVGGAGGGAAAGRLRQMLPTLVVHIARAGHAVQTIKVKVATPEQIEWRRSPTERHISAEAKAGLNAFARSLPEDSPLRASPERLVKRGKD